MGSVYDIKQHKGTVLLYPFENCFFTKGGWRKLTAFFFEKSPKPHITNTATTRRAKLLELLTRLKINYIIIHTIMAELGKRLKVKSPIMIITQRTVPCLPLSFPNRPLSYSYLCNFSTNHTCCEASCKNFRRGSSFASSSNTCYEKINSNTNIAKL